MLRDFEQEAKGDLGGRFTFLCRDRYDLSKTITILGYTLWSAIAGNQERDIVSRSTDLNSKRGIQNWTLERHKEEHAKNLTWLSSQIATIEQLEPGRQIIVVTHYSPTTDSRANDPRHAGSSTSSNFVTNLSQQLCWLSSAVKLWAFGHTHYSCNFKDQTTGKLVIANQKGYETLRTGMKRIGLRAKVVEVGVEGWELVERERNDGEEQSRRIGAQTKEPVIDENKITDAKTPKASFLDRVGERMKCLRGARRTVHSVD